MKRRFELAGPPRQFWELELKGGIAEFRWGTEGRAPQMHARAVNSTLDDFIAKQVQSLLARGFVEVEVAEHPPLVPEPASTHEKRDPVEVQRLERLVWHGRRYVAIAQKGAQLLETGGDIVDGEDRPNDRTRRTRVFATVAEATAAFDEAVANAREGNYASTEVRAPAIIRDNPELEAECLAQDTPDAWAVYADWLIGQGDPRGEIAQLHLAGKTAAARSVLARHLAELCGNTSRAYELRFRHGFARGATIARDNHDDSDAGELAALTRDLLLSPMGRFLEELRFGLAGFSDDNTWAPTLREIVDSPRAPEIRELRFDAYDYTDSEISWTPFGDLAFAWPHLPALEVLKIKSGAGGTLGALELPRLRVLIRESGGLAADEIEAIVAAIVEGRLPALEHLELWFGSSNYGAGVSLEMLSPIFAAQGLPRLTHLGLVNCELADQFVDQLAHARILPQLHSLDLSRGTLAEAGTRHFVRYARAFRHLASIDLSRNLLVASEAAQIRAVLDNVIVVDQRERDDDDLEAEDRDPDEPVHRFVDVGE